MTKRNTVLPVPAFMPAVLALVGPEEKNSNAPPQRMSSRPMSRRHANAKAIPQNTPGADLEMTYVKPKSSKAKQHDAAEQAIDVGP